MITIYYNHLPPTGSAHSADHISFALERALSDHNALLLLDYLAVLIIWDLEATLLKLLADHVDICVFCLYQP